jgi:hypothetical protein
MKLRALICWKTAWGQYSKQAALPNAIAGLSVELICRYRVVRHTGGGETPAVAAIIDEYQLRPVPEEV